MLRQLLLRLSSSLLIACGLLMLNSCAGDSAPGEVVLLVSTDLSVPTDVDTLHVTVSRSGESATLTDECYWLGTASAGMPSDCTATSLPGSLALVSSDKTNGPLQVHLELRQGGAKGPVRVARDAELRIPTEGVKQLPLALNFLCLEAGLTEPCTAGTTCQAGSCVDDKSEDLADYVPGSSGDCFDVEACFGSLISANSTVPEEDPDLKKCSIRGSQTLGVEDINVALVVNPAVVGNQGVCDSASGKCVVPLNRGPEGWQTLTDSKGRAVAIGLPEAVCAAIGSSISAVAIAPSQPCGVKDASVGLCPTPPTCVASSEFCPEAWSGYSCSGVAKPADLSTPQDWCGEVATDATRGPLVPGLWCCGKSDPAKPDPLLIDDMSSGPLIKIDAPTGYLPGGWFTATDDSNAVLSPPPFPPALFAYRTIEPAVTPTKGGPTISRAACLRSEGFTGYAALEGFSFLRAPPDNQAVAMDVGRYTGISFWAHAVPPAPGKLNLPTELRVQFPNLDTYTERSSSTCIKKAGRAQCDDFGEVLTLPSDGGWAQYSVKWADLAQQGFGLPFTSFNTNVYTTIFLIPGPGPDSRSLPFDFCVAQLEFTQD